MKKILIGLTLALVLTGCATTKKEEVPETPDKEEVVETTPSETEANEDETQPSTEEVDSVEETPKEEDKTATTTKPAETKPTETKPSTSTTTSKPAESKPSTSNSTTQTKPNTSTTKPAETKPAETKPAESKPSTTTPAKPADKVTYTTEYVRVNVVPVTKESKTDPNLEEGYTRYESGYEGYTEKTLKHTFVNGVKTKTEVVYEHTVKMKPDVEYTGTKKPAPVTFTVDLAASKELFNLMNETRKANGAQPLVWDEALYKVALIRGEDLVKVFSHDRPDGSSWSSLLPPHNGAAENIAAGQKTATAFNNSWTNSPGHFANRTNTAFTKYAAVIVRLSNGGTAGVELFMR